MVKEETHPLQGKRLSNLASLASGTCVCSKVRVENRCVSLSYHVVVQKSSKKPHKLPWGSFSARAWFTHCHRNQDYCECVSHPQHPPGFHIVFTSHSYHLCIFSVSQSSSLISSATAAALLSSGAVDYCLHVLKSLLEYWKSQQNDEEPVATSQLLKPHTTSSPPDMSPFFLRQYVKVRYFPHQRNTRPLFRALHFSQPSMGFWFLPLCKLEDLNEISVISFHIKFRKRWEGTS